MNNDDLKKIYLSIKNKKESLKDLVDEELRIKLENEIKEEQKILFEKLNDLEEKFNEMIKNHFSEIEDNENQEKIYSEDMEKTIQEEELNQLYSNEYEKSIINENQEKIYDEDAEETTKEKNFENKETKDLKENIKNDFKAKEIKNIEINEKNSQIPKSIIFLVIMLMLSFLGIFFYRSLNNKVVDEKVVTVANPDSFNLNGTSDISNEDEKFEKNDEEEEVIKEPKKDNNEIKEENIEVVEDKNINNSKLDEDIKEIDRAINDISNTNQDEEIASKKVQIAFLKKSIDESKNNSSSNNKNNNSNSNSDRINRKFEARFYSDDDNQIEDKRTNIFKNDDKYILKQGSILPSILLTELNTDLPGVLLAQIREDVYDTRTGNYLLIPKGSKLYGLYEARVLPGQNRVFAYWNKLILPNGDYVDLSLMSSTDAEGRSGLSDKVDNHTWQLIGNGILSSIFNFGNNLTKSVKFNINNKEFGLNGNTTDKDDKGGSPFEKATGKILERSVDRAPTLTIRRGYNFNIIVNSDLYLDDYKY